MKQAARLLSESLQGKANATNELVAILDDQLRDIADRHLRRERTDHTLQPTALVNEAYLRLLGQSQVDWKNTSHFRAIASNVMRRILVDHARAKAAEKRGGDCQRVYLMSTPATDGHDPAEIMAVNDLLETLAELNPRHAKIVEYRMFGGLTLAEIADALSVSLATVKKDWRCAKAWLLSQLESEC